MFTLPAICSVAHSRGFLISSKQRRIRARQLFRHHRGADALGAPHQVRSGGERFHAPLQIAFDVIETDTAQPQGGFLLASGLSDDHDGLGAIEHRASPGGVLPAESDVDAAGEVTLGILGGVADVEDLSARVSHPKDLGQIDGMENLFEILVQRGALASIEDGVVGEVRRSVGLVGRDQTNEFLLRHRLQRIIQAPLISER